MKNKLSKLALAMLLSLSAASANAAAYNFSNTVFDFYNHVNGANNDQYRFFMVGTTPLYSKSITMYAPTGGRPLESGGDFVYNNGDGLIKGTYTLVNHSVTYDPNDSNIIKSESFIANLNFTSGTGIFANTTGSGVFQAALTFGSSWIETSQNAALFSASSTAPVPEADTSAMLLMGAGVMGFMARRRKQVKA